MCRLLQLICSTFVIIICRLQERQIYVHEMVFFLYSFYLIGGKVCPNYESKIFYYRLQVTENFHEDILRNVFSCIIRLFREKQNIFNSRIMFARLNNDWATEGLNSCALHTMFCLIPEI